MLLVKDDIKKINYLLGVVYLLYPILGWISDIQIPRYKMIKLSLIMNLLAGVFALLYAIDGQIQYIPSTSLYHFVKTISIGTIIIYVASLGMYKANAIQFGLQQLHDASSEILSSFIHWYYWSIYI